MDNAWLRIQPSSRTARILLAALFALPVISYLVLPWFPTYREFSLGEGLGACFFLLAGLVVGFPLAGIPVLLIVFGSIFLWEEHRKSLSIAWLACWVWFSFAAFVAQYSAPLWYRADSWGYTFAFEQSWPVAGIAGALFFLAALLLARVAFEPSGSVTRRDATITRIIAIGCLGVIAVVSVVFISGRLDEARMRRVQEAMREMTPEKLITNCGQPASDEQTDFLNLHTLFARVLTYKPGNNWSKLEFKRDTTRPWHLTHFASPVIEVSPSDDDSYLAIRQQLPCMVR